MTLELDSSQRKFCDAPSGNNIRLLAPAGCGKTLCLLFRCKHLIEQNRRRRQKFLIVTFTQVARDELRGRINTESEFEALRGDRVEVMTLNSWGYRRIKGDDKNYFPNLITSQRDYHFTMLNNLQTVWQSYPSVKRAIVKKRNTTPLALMDAFRSLGFDHERHSDFDQFDQHLQLLQGQGLTRKLQQQFEELTKLGVLETKIVADGSEVPESEAEEKSMSPSSDSGESPRHNCMVAKSLLWMTRNTSLTSTSVRK